MPYQPEIDGHNPINWAQVSADQWAEHCIDFSCYGTEPSKEFLVHVHGLSKVRIGKVQYHGTKADCERTYFINREARDQIRALGHDPRKSDMPSLWEGIFKDLRPGTRAFRRAVRLVYGTQDD